MNTKKSHNINRLIFLSWVRGNHTGNSEKNNFPFIIHLVPFIPDLKNTTFTQGNIEALSGIIVLPN